jgi:hypothetical protein
MGFIGLSNGLDSLALRRVGLDCAGIRATMSSKLGNFDLTGLGGAGLLNVEGEAGSSFVASRLLGMTTLF